MELIDIGANLIHDSFASDRQRVIAAAQAAGVVQMMITGSCEQSSVAAANLVRDYPGRLFSTAGVHPHHAADYSSDLDSVLRELTRQDVVRAVGECGLDYFRDISPRPMQQQAFTRQLEIAVDIGLPLFLHQRDAHEDFLAILRDYRDRLQQIVVHCFTGQREEMLAYLELDCHIGITGWICDERRGHHLKEFVSDIPAGRLMVESDSPYLKPRNLRPKVKTHRNEPQWLPWTVGTIAACRHEPPLATAAHTTATARAFFDLPEVSAP
ncbi:MAG: TatD family hydrolase [Wenzhouxiangellaceae bacterium]